MKPTPHAGLAAGGEIGDAHLAESDEGKRGAARRLVVDVRAAERCAKRCTKRGIGNERLVHGGAQRHRSGAAGTEIDKESES